MPGQQVGTVLSFFFAPAESRLLSPSKTGVARKQNNLGAKYTLEVWYTHALPVPKMGYDNTNPKRVSERESFANARGNNAKS